jgi:DNA-binding IclR family transcriptional regulator
MFDYICEFKAESGGDSPTIEQIKEATGQSSKSTVHRQLVRMVAFGMIERKGHTIRVYGGYWQKPGKKTN